MSSTQCYSFNSLRPELRSSTVPSLTTKSTRNDTVVLTQGEKLNFKGIS
jgi:hypothetical protein